MINRFHFAVPSGLLTTFVVFCLLTALEPVSFGQALPAAEAAPISTGFSLPTELGSLQYAVSASQSLSWGYYGGSGDYAASNITGDLAFLSNSKLRPFSLVFSGGYSFGESGQSSYEYVGLGASQVLTFGRWNLVLSDDLTYLPGTATTGLSGVAGVGDLGVNPIQVGEDTGQGVLTNFSNRIGNDATAGLTRQITGKTSVTASGGYDTMRFLSSSVAGSSASSAGLDNDAYTGVGGISHQLNARNSFGASYSYSSYGYTGDDFGVPTQGFVSQTASGSYTHQFTRKLTVSGSAGPQWTGIKGSDQPAALSLYVDVTGSYAAKTFNSSLIFVRSSNSGYGVTGGALSDSIVLGASRKFGVVWNCSLSSAYTQSSNLPVAGVPSFSADTYVEAVQISRALARSLSAYASYTLERQTNSGLSTIDIYSGTSQIVGFGVTYSPAATHLGRQ